jgi:acyl-CoA synthetase (AMP-forming)/AMP-acid ligase II
MQAISEQRGTLCWLPNFAYNFCAQKIRDRDLEGVDLSSIRAFINCSEPAYHSSHQLFAERFHPYGIDINKLAVCYAMAETVFGVSQTPIGVPARVDTVERKALRAHNYAEAAVAGSKQVEQIVSTGYPIPGMEVRVLDANRTELPERQVGEIAVRSPYMLTEYYHRPDATEDAFHEGWYLTGDMGYLADGEVFVLGRKKDLLIVGGRNIYPQDLEALVSTVEGVHPGRVAVFGIPNPATGTEEASLVAEVETDDEEAQNAIRAAIRRAVASGSDIAVRHVWLVPRGWLIKTSTVSGALCLSRKDTVNISRCHACLRKSGFSESHLERELQLRNILQPLLSRQTCFF